MGKMEEESKRRTKKNELRKIILQSVAAAGLLSMALLAPNVIQVLEAFGYKPGKRKEEIIGISRRKLVEKGLLKYEGKFLKLTKKGESVLRHLELKDFKLKKPRKWDKKWRIISFDVKENRKEIRDKIRKSLVSIGFVCLHRSVWVYPYDCENLITLLKADFEIGKDVLYIIADAIENDKWLKEKFNLEDKPEKPSKVEKAIGDFLFGPDKKK